MEIRKQIQERRTAAGISQEELAERLYVTRQTLSNWETGKTYPDINSLLRLSDLFHISLDELVKGDLQAMEEQIKKEDIKRFRRDKNILIILLLGLTALSLVVMFLWNETAGKLLCYYSTIAVLLYSHSVTKLQQKYEIYTFREIKAFLEGKRLDELEIKQLRAKSNIVELIVIVAVVGILSAIIVPNLM